MRRGDGGRTLQWNEPQNAPEDCISSYRITIDGVHSLTTDNNETFISLDDILDLLSCEEQSITVTPVVPVVGPFEHSTSEQYVKKGKSCLRGGTTEHYSYYYHCNLIVYTEFPSPENVEVEYNYTEYAIAVSIGWEVKI